jgi:hypothetical protein
VIKTYDKERIENKRAQQPQPPFLSDPLLEQVKAFHHHGRRVCLSIRSEMGCAPESLSDESTGKLAEPR